MAKQKHPIVTDQNGYSEQYHIAHLDHMEGEDIDLDKLFPPRTEEEQQAIRDEIRARTAEYVADIDADVATDLASRRAHAGYNEASSEQYNIAYSGAQHQSE